MLMEYSIDFRDAFTTSFSAIFYNDFVTNLFDLVYPIGIAAMCVFFLLDMMDTTMHKNFNIEFFIRGLLKFVVALIMLNLLKDLFCWFDTFSNSLIDDLNLDTADLKDYFQVVAERLYIRAAAPGGIASTLKNLSSGLLIFGLFAICILLVNIAVYTVAIRRAIEITIFYIFSPFIVSTMFFGNLTDFFARLKKVLALYLQYPFVCLIVTFGFEIANNFTNNKTVSTSSVAFLAIIVLASTRKLISSSKNDIQRILGS